MSNPPLSQAEYTADTFKPLLKQLAQSPATFPQSQATVAFEHIALNAPTPAQIGAFLTALTLSKADQRPEIVTACATVMKAFSVKVDVGKSRIDSKTGKKKRVVDIVGTGGDGWDTFNVSTTAGLVGAAAGAIVCKHGNKAATSTSGSADVLLALDLSFVFPPSSLPDVLGYRSSPSLTDDDDSGSFAFLFAPLYHPSLGALAPVRKSLPFRTIFNVLGPLINPSNPNGMVLGVASKELGIVFAESLKALGTVERGLVVCGEEGLDEISCAGASWAWSITEGCDEIEHLSLHPTKTFGLPCHSLACVKGSLPHQNAETILSFLSPTPTVPSHLTPTCPTGCLCQIPEGHVETPEEKDKREKSLEGCLPSYNAIKDFVLLNSAALLVTAGMAEDFKHGIRLAREAMLSGNGEKIIRGFREGVREAVEKGVPAVPAQV